VRRFITRFNQTAAETAEASTGTEGAKVTRLPRSKRSR
jgi:hypothetical protein